MNHSWPGNVRELQNALQRYLAVGNVDFLETGAGDGEIRAGGIPSIGGGQSQSPGEGFRDVSGGFDSLQDNIQAVEKDIIQKTLRQHNGNKSKVAKTLKISRKTLARKMERLSLE